MEPAGTPVAIELTKAVGGIASDLKWSFVSCLFLYLVRDGISAFVKRLVNLDFKWGQAQGSLKAEPCPDGSALLPVLAQSEKPSDASGDAEITESINIEEEQKSDWFSVMHHAFVEGRIKDGKEAFQKHQATVTDANERTRVRAIYLHLDYSKWLPRGTGPTSATVLGTRRT